MMDVLKSVVLSHFHIVSMLLCVLKINLAPFLQDEALNDNVMRNYVLTNFVYFVLLLYYMFGPLVLNDLYPNLNT